MNTVMKEPAVPSGPIQLHPEVADAVRAGRAVVALESTILAHGLPRGDNRTIADRIEGRVRAAGAVPATIAVFDGVVRVGLTAPELDRLCGDDGIAKLSVRDVGVAVALGVTGATIASTSALADVVGVEVFATGGLGGVHRGAAESFDISADLGVLGRTPILVVCAGVKSILDVPATLEYLETLSVPVLGYRTDGFPGFFLSDSGQGVPWRVDTPLQAAAVVRARKGPWHRPRRGGAGQPVAGRPPARSGPHDRTLAHGLAVLADEGVTGNDVTPRLLEYFHSATHGESLRANVELVQANAFLAGEVAAALAGQPGADAGRQRQPSPRGRGRLR